MAQADVIGPGPLVSIIVPLADHAGDGAQRLASAREQTWPNIEVIAVDTAGAAGRAGAVSLPGAAVGPAIVAGISASRGAWICLLLPGVSYAPHKVQRQVEFTRQMELPDAVIYSDHVLQRPGQVDSLVELGYADPAVFWERWLCAVPPHPCSLLLPRSAIAQWRLPDDGAVDAALYASCMRLAHTHDFVGIAEPLIRVVPQPPDRGARQRWREVHTALLAEVLPGPDDPAPSVATFAMLGAVAQARVDAELMAPAWDAARVAWRLTPRAAHPLAALRAFARPLLGGLARRLPLRLRALLRRTRARATQQPSPQLDFVSIYRGNGFAGTESLSGAGSTRFQTRIIRREIPLLLRRLGVRSLLDIPCGDFHWMCELNLDGIRYIGADVVPEMIEANRRRFGSATRDFVSVDLITGLLPAADAMLCRDCLVHLPLNDALAAIATIRRSRCEWLLATTFPGTQQNQELDSAGWRPLNLNLPPFNLPPPVAMIVEGCTEAGGRAADKALGLWRIADLPELFGG